MICEHCRKRTATTHITESINGVTKRMDLCSFCASELGFSGYMDNMNIGNLLSSVFLSDAPARREEKRCPVCKKGRSRIIENGKAGCAECYNVFRTELLSPIEKIHGKASHIGKRPLVSDNSEVNDDELSRLSEELKEAIEKEDFEKAASIRDEIRELKGEGK